MHKITISDITQHEAIVSPWSFGGPVKTGSEIVEQLEMYAGAVRTYGECAILGDVKFYERIERLSARHRR